MVNCLESEIYNKRNDLGIKRVYKLVDTCALNLLRLLIIIPPLKCIKNQEGRKVFTDNESKSSNNKKIIVLGSGPNRIGQGIEFDYSCVHGVFSI